MTKMNTKRALLMSALALLLCVSMLIGSTYAWFTDSVTSGNNIIKSGNLDVELEYKKVVDGVITDWDDVSGKDQLFDKNALWEPGHTEVVYLKVSNVGTLDLKYQLGVNIIEEIGSTNVYDKEFKLSDYLVFSVAEITEAEVGTFDTRDKAIEKAGTVRGLKDYNGTTTPLADGEADYLALIVYMPTDVDNNANYKKGFNAPYIELGVNLYATQVEAESDSFGTDYDKDAWFDGMKVYDADDLQAALANGKNAVLQNDITLTEAVQIPEGATVVLDMNGYDLSGSVRNLIYSQGNLTITGEGEITSTLNGYSYAIRAQKGTILVDGNITVNSEFGCVEVYNGAEVTINNGSYYAKGVNGMTSHTVYVKNSKLTINGGTFDSGYSSEGIGTITGSNSTVNIYGGTIYASELGNSFYMTNVTIYGGTYQYDPTTLPANKNNVVADGFIVVDNGDGTYSVVPDGMTLVEGYPHLYTDGANNYYVYDAQGLKSLNNWFNMWNAYGNTFNVMADINASGYTWNCKMIAPNGDNTPGFTFNGNGNTISNLTIAGGGLFTLTTNGTLATVPTTFTDITFDNVTVTGGYHTGVVWGQVAGDLVLNDVHVTNSNITGECNVSGLVGSTGEFAIDASVKYVDCSVTNTIITATGAAGCDPTGANAFMGRALGDTSLVFEGNNVADDNTYVNANGLVGGGIYGYTTWANGGFVGTGKCDTFTAWKGITALDSNGSLADAVNSGASEVVLPSGEYKMPSSATTGNVTITGTKDTVLDVTKGAYMDSANVTIEGVTIKTSTGYVMDENGNKGSDYAALYSTNTTYVNCTFVGPLRVGRDGAKFINCTFTELGNDYVWTYGNDVTFEGCTFNTDGKAILIYSDGGNEISEVVVKDCTFNATTGAKAGAIANQNCAAIEIHNYGNGVNLTTSGNTYDNNFSGEWRIKTYEAGKPGITVNGVTYTTIAIDGKTMTIDANKNVTVQ